MPTTLGQVLSRANSHLHGPYHEEFAVLAVGVDTDDTVVTLDEEPVTLAVEATIQRGSIINVGTEVMLVRGWDSALNQATVFRGHLGSPAAAHVAGDFVQVAPRFPRGVMWLDLLEELASLPTAIYRLVQEEVTVVAGINGERVVAVPLTMVGAYGLRVMRAAHLSGEWQRYARLNHRYELTDAGPVLILDEYRENGEVLDLQARMPIDTTAATEATTIEDLGLLGSMADVLSYGVAVRRLAWAESQRSDRQVQGEPRVAEESPPMHALQTSEGLRRIYDRRLATEATRLVALHGWQM